VLALDAEPDVARQTRAQDACVFGRCVFCGTGARRIGVAPVWPGQESAQAARPGPASRAWGSPFRRHTTQRDDCGAEIPPKDLPTLGLPEQAFSTVGSLHDSNGFAECDALAPSCHDESVQPSLGGSSRGGRGFLVTGGSSRATSRKGLALGLLGAGCPLPLPGVVASSFRLLIAEVLFLSCMSSVGRHGASWGDLRVVRTDDGQAPDANDKLRTKPAPGKASRGAWRPFTEIASLG
jgi:hypothetical protein